MVAMSRDIFMNNLKSLPCPYIPKKNRNVPVILPTNKTVLCIGIQLPVVQLLFVFILIQIKYVQTKIFNKCIFILFSFFGAYLLYFHQILIIFFFIFLNFLRLITQFLPNLAENFFAYLH